LGNGSADEPITVWRQVGTKDFFDYSVGENGMQEAAGVQYANAYCVNGNSANGHIYPTLTLTDTGTQFSADTYYSVGISISLNGLQESNLVTAPDIQATGTEFARIIIKAKGAIGTFSAFDKRITAIKIYMAESDDDNLSNLGLHRLIKTIDINDTGWADNGDDSDLTYDYYPETDIIEGGNTYEEETGISETLNPTYVHYGMNETGGGYHWMARGYVPATTPPINKIALIFASYFTINLPKYTLSGSKASKAKLFHPTLLTFPSIFISSEITST